MAAISAEAQEEAATKKYKYMDEITLRKLGLGDSYEDYGGNPRYRNKCGDDVHCEFIVVFICLRLAVSLYLDKTKSWAEKWAHLRTRRKEL